MDKEWTKFPRFSSEYIEGVESFLDFAYTRGRPQGDEILCPCAKCTNSLWARRHVVRDHLIAKGFLKKYDVWVHHGERITLPMETDDVMEDQEDSHDDIGGLLYDTIRNVAAEGISEGPNKDARKFYNMIDEGKKELYPGCKKQYKASFMVSPQSQFKSSDFAVIGQAQMTKNKQIQNPKGKLITHSKESIQIQDPMKQPIKKTIAQHDDSRAKQQTMQKAMAQDDMVTSKKQRAMERASIENGSSMANQQPMRRKAVESDNSRTIQQPMKRKVIEDNSRANQQSKKRIEAGNDNSRAKQQHIKGSAIEIGNSRTNQQSIKRAAAENDSSRAKQQPKKRVVAENDNSSGRKREKRVPMCSPMLIGEFLRKNGEVDEEEELGDESEDEELNIVEQEENVAPEEDGEGTSKKRTRGPTMCLKIHTRATQDREEVILDNDGEPIGPDDRTVSDLSLFLGTIARNAEFCPLIYTNFKALLKNHKEDIWEYVNDKFNIPKKGEKAVFSRINDAWRQYKSKIKKKHFQGYSTMKERLKHRPECIPKTHFEQLMAYWRSDIVQDIAKKNAINRAKQKYLHRMGPVNFARIRAKLRAKKKEEEEVSQAEMFIETRTSRNGKEIDEETQSIIGKLKDSVQEPGKSAKKTFQSLLGKEKPGRVRCYGRTVTPSQFKRNEEIALIKKEHANEMNRMKMLVRSLLKQNNPDLDDEALDMMMANATASENGATPHPSTSTNIHILEKVGEECHVQDIEDEE